MDSTKATLKAALSRRVQNRKPSNLPSLDIPRITGSQNDSFESSQQTQTPYMTNDAVLTWFQQASSYPTHQDSNMQDSQLERLFLFEGKKRSLSPNATNEGQMLLGSNNEASQYKNTKPTALMKRHSKQVSRPKSSKPHVGPAKSSAHQLYDSIVSPSIQMISIQSLNDGISPAVDVHMFHEHRQSSVGIDSTTSSIPPHLPPVSGMMSPILINSPLQQSISLPPLPDLNVATLSLCQVTHPGSSTIPEATHRQENLFNPQQTIISSLPFPPKQPAYEQQYFTSIQGGNLVYPALVSSVQNMDGIHMMLDEPPGDNVLLLEDEQFNLGVFIHEPFPQTPDDDLFASYQMEPDEEEEPFMESDMSKVSESRQDSVDDTNEPTANSSQSSVQSSQLKRKRGARSPKKNSEATVPRPPNAFILYRGDKHKKLMSEYTGPRSEANRIVSKMVSDLWRRETPEVRALYSQKANVAKINHMMKYPDYKYTPRQINKASATQSEKLTTPRSGKRNSMRTPSNPDDQEINSSGGGLIEENVMGTLANRPDQGSTHGPGQSFHQAMFQPNKFLRRDHEQQIPSHYIYQSQQPNQQYLPRSSTLEQLFAPPVSHQVSLVETPSQSNILKP